MVPGKSLYLPPYPSSSYISKGGPRSVTSEIESIFITECIVVTLRRLEKVVSQYTDIPRIYLSFREEMVWDLTEETWTKS